MEEQKESQTIIMDTDSARRQMTRGKKAYVIDWSELSASKTDA